MKAPEKYKNAVSKTVELAIVPRVRIPVSPPLPNIMYLFLLFKLVNNRQKITL